MIGFNKRKGENPEVLQEKVPKEQKNKQNETTFLRTQVIERELER